MSHTITDRELDRLCWLLVSTRNRFYPPDETAEECIDHFEEASEENEVIAYPDDKARGDEHGYHRGMFTAYNEIIENLYLYGVNVLGRANRYTHVHREHGAELRTDDQPDYYRAVEYGAEVDAVTSDLYDPIEIESLDWDDPYPVPTAE